MQRENILFIYGDCKPENVVRMAEAIRKYGRYPTAKHLK